jgi:hypothetical protein
MNTPPMVKPFKVLSMKRRAELVELERSLQTDLESLRFRADFAFEWLESAPRGERRPWTAEENARYEAEGRQRGRIKRLLRKLSEEVLLGICRRCHNDAADTTDLCPHCQQELDDSYPGAVEAQALAMDDAYANYKDEE